MLSPAVLVTQCRAYALTTRSQRRVSVISYSPGSYSLGSWLQHRGGLSYELGFRVIDAQLQIPCHRGLLSQPHVN